MTDHFCTYFDHRFAAKGLAMWKSLKRVCPSAALDVLCLNDACREILAARQLQDVHLHSLETLENADPDLRRARVDRSLVEYYFTLTPCLPLYILRTQPGVPRLTYLDADLFFFADPRPVLDEVGEHAVGLIEHRFPAELADRERYGRFNVGWLTFRNDSIALKCLETWRDQCLEWCYDRLEPGRFAEQKYLDDWPGRFDGIRTIQHRGANVAPWNLNRFEVSPHVEGLRVGGQPLLFFHAHGFEPRSPGRPRELNLKSYRVEETPLLLRSIFDPYEQALLEATTEIAVPLALALLSDQSRDTVLLLESLKAQLSASEADRAARLAVIRTLQQHLEASEGDRAARLEEIHALQQHLKASEADSVARLDTIHSVQKQLETKDADLDQIRAQLGRARSRVDDLERSRSWRWTKPARWAAGRLGYTNGRASSSSLRGDRGENS